MKPQKKAFTFVELVVVMIVIVILSLVSFLYSKNSTINARNTNRITDIGTLQNSLELYHSQNGQYILPDNAKNLLYTETDTDKITFAYQGTFGNLSKVAFKYKHIKVDPLDKTAYTYSISKDKENYQIISFLEKNKKSKIVAPSAGAVDTLSNRQVKLYGNPVGIFVDKTTLVPANFTSGIDFVDINNDTSYGLYLNDEDNLIQPGNSEFKQVVPNSSCLRLLELGNKKSRNYDILTDYLAGTTTKTYCNMTSGTGGWTAIWRAEKSDYTSTDSFDYTISPEKLNASKMMIGYINNAQKLTNYYYFDIPTTPTNLKTTSPFTVASTESNLSKVTDGETGVEYISNVKLLYGNTGGKIAITGDAITDTPEFTGFTSSGVDNCGTVAPVAKQCGNKKFIILVK
ncbi:MAG: prepilin-type N-terminal cleavage/methylation domain-containing protein [Candidatus Gracilibacteria bacterium]|nr:prepilin-type N-terminal cleavage/methylation domain-containing protein [Candidatus Gracilibacteria bacterium]